MRKSNYFSRNSQEQILFNPDDYIKRPMSDQTEFNELILPFVGAIREAFRLTVRALRKLHEEYPPHYFSNKVDPTLFNSFYLGFLQSELGADYFGELEQRKFLTLGRYILYFKKIGHDFEPRNIMTQTTTKINRQYAKVSEVQNSVIYIGYMIKNGNWAEDTELFAIYKDEENSENEWITPFSLLEHMAKSTDNQLEIVNDSSNTEPRVKVREMPVVEAV